MGVVRIEADPSGVLPGRFWDAFSLFEEAGRAYDGNDFAKAESLYARIPAEFADSDLVAPATFNRGLALERLQRPAEAEALYESLLAGHPGAVHADEVVFRIGACQEARGNWDAAARTYGVRARALALAPLREAEAEVRRGVALYHLARGDEAIDALRGGLASFRKLRLNPVRVPEDVIGEGYFTLGEIYRGRSEAVSLDVPEDRQARALDSRSELLLLARAQYTQAIRSYTATWMTAALCRIGEGYEAFWSAAMAAPLPDGLTLAETTEYKKKMEKEMAPVLHNAVAAHRRNVNLSTELGISNAWTQTSRLKLQSLPAE